MVARNKLQTTPPFPVEQALNSLTRLQVPPGLEWEVVVINNNSPDGTTAVLESFVSKLPLRHFLETNQGIAFARNRAAREAGGDVVLWTDDDIQVKPNWLARYASEIASHSDCGFFGGPVELLFEGNPPQWLLDGLDSVGGALGQVKIPGYLAIGEGPELPFNCNMAVRREHHLSMPYDTRYGRKAGSLVSGEETVFMRELLARGIKGRWSAPHGAPRASNDRSFTKSAHRRRARAGHALSHPQQTRVRRDTTLVVA